MVDGIGTKLGASLNELSEELLRRRMGPFPMATSFAEMYIPDHHHAIRDGYDEAISIGAVPILTGVFAYSSPKDHSWRLLFYKF